MSDSMDSWLSKASQFDERALTEIYQVLSPRLYRYAYRLLGNAGDAEDVVAESFHRLLLALKNGDGPRQYLSAYLYRIVHNLITDRYRRKPQLDMPLDEMLEACQESDPLHSAALNMAQERARAALRLLTADQRLVITLKYFEGLSNEEVAAALDKPIGAVKSLQHRGLAALRRMLVVEQVEEMI